MTEVYMTIAGLNETKAFMEGIPGVTVLQSDSPDTGQIGYYAFYLRDKVTGQMHPTGTSVTDQTEEIEIWIGAQVCGKTKWIEGTDEHGIMAPEHVEDHINMVLRTSGWCTCDDPKNRLMGFMRPQHGSDSEAFMVRLDDIKRIPKSAMNGLTAWRQAHKDFREAALVPKGYLSIIADEL